MSASQFLADSKRRGAQWFYQKTGLHNVERDADFEDTNERFNRMAEDINELGAGVSSSLRDVKTSFATSQKLARVMDKFYNGEYARPWPEVNEMGQLRSHASAARFKTTWNHVHGKVRPSAAAVCIERSLDRLRNFSNSSVPELKARVSERNTAELDYRSYERRAQKAQGGDPAVLTRLEAQMKLSKEHYDTLNQTVKDELIKEKMARDVMVEETFMTLVVCQAEVYNEIAQSLNDLVQAFPPERVLSIQSKIKDLVRVGGPQVQEKDTSDISKAAQVALGVKTVSDFSKTDKQKAAEADQAQERLRAARELAQEEESIRKELRPAMPTVAHPSAAAVVPPPSSSYRRGVIRARALFDCEAESEGDLAFHAGDIITVTSQEDSGWWQGSLGANSGAFPANYVQVME